MPTPAPVGCDVAAIASVSAAAGDLPALRRSPGTLGGGAVGPSLLKHADEQTVVGVSAVLRAARDGGLDPAGFGGWAVVAAPRFLGRSAFEASFPLFLAEGVWGVSPLLISSHSLHAVAGVVSQALKAHGPNLGAGGAPGGEVEALLTAAAWLDQGSVPGVWVVLTGWDAGRERCEALALGLTAARSGWDGARLKVRPGAVRVEPPSAVPALDAWLGAAVVRGGVDGPAVWRVDGAHPTAAAPHARTGRVVGTGDLG